LKSLIGKNKTAIIDEVQCVENIGLCIKLITDNMKQVKIFATGSSVIQKCMRDNFKHILVGAVFSMQYGFTEGR